MSQPSIFDSEIALPNEGLFRREKTLLGFDRRYVRVHDQLRLLLNVGDLGKWNQKHHGGKLALCGLVAEQYPLVIFHGDVGTGKTAMAECIANRLVAEARSSDSMLFKLSNRVRGNGMVGEMGTLIAEAFRKVTLSAGKTRRAILIIDEGDSLAASRSQDHSHHEDKVAVNTLIQGIDDLRQYGGRVVVILCTNRLSVLDPALRRRATIIETFNRPTDAERQQLFEMDLVGMGLNRSQLDELTRLTGAHDRHPSWTYSDIRTRLYPAALAKAYPDRALSFADLSAVASTLNASPVMEDK
ncbi:MULTISPECIES: AAA family ATPase [Aeromonas]|jgi:SpoVK/Ycf46/Vps4 family AAA+-type ATPase|uniref:ATPase n=1 Tax=Aeromonas veronii TaxID=654 RepID=A0A2T4MZ46_AERVE|nr:MULTISPECIES: ATP-binding protein [Aeromonas]AVP83510.1 ATPase [Aeromonas hydrophila]KER63465.1 ATPase [Aeromonas hydrophila]MBW3798894.1 AAA family ATPase [Aeromonas hydrophila]MBW3803447.1 AAA family ATPase [Aeromonas hydrophila]MBW3821191.1 AAA family ATPase [Aeromonas hydrophila]